MASHFPASARANGQTGTSPSAKFPSPEALSFTLTFEAAKRIYVETVREGFEPSVLFIDGTRNSKPDTLSRNCLEIANCSSSQGAAHTGIEPARPARAAPHYPTNSCWGCNHVTTASANVFGAVFHKQFGLQDPDDPASPVDNLSIETHTACPYSYWQMAAGPARSID